MITLTPLNNPEGAIQQEYSSSQEALIPVVDSTSEFNPVTDQVIFSVETVTGELLQSGKVSNFTIRNYENTLNEDQISSVVVFPIRDLQNNLMKNKAIFLKLIEPILLDYVATNNITYLLQKKYIIVGHNDLDKTIDIIELVDKKINISNFNDSITK